MKLLLLLLCFLCTPLAGQDWRFVDPTDETPDRRTASDRYVDPGYSDVRFRDGSGRQSSNSGGGDFNRADIWQVGGGSSGATFPVDYSTARVSQQLPDEKKPWSSTYWPFQHCDLAFKSYSGEGLSPMELYDTYVNATRGQNPGSAAWEGSSVAKTLVVGGGREFGRPQLVWTWRLGHNMVPWLDPSRKGFASVPYNDPNGGRGMQSVQIDWWGHCNGWASASILVPEPPERVEVQFDRPITKLRLRSDDPAWPGQDNALGRSAYSEERTNRRSLVFTGADLKGLFTEAYLSTAARLSHPNNPSFYKREDWGRRYDPESGSQEEQLAAYRDVAPHNFHRIMLDHMERETGLVADKDANEHINNMPIVGWQHVRNFNQRANAYDIQARVLYADYAPPTYRGTKLMAIDYTYRIYLDRRNRVTDGQWLGNSAHNHPDFMWVPEKPLPAPLKRNPAVKLETLEEILKQARG